jgi:hypothetical protein
MLSAETPPLEWRLPEKTRVLVHWLFNNITSNVRLCKYECHERMITCGELERTFGMK